MRPSSGFEFGNPVIGNGIFSSALCLFKHPFSPSYSPSPSLSLPTPSLPLSLPLLLQTPTDQNGLKKIIKKFSDLKCGVFLCLKLAEKKPEIISIRLVSSKQNIMFPFLIVFCTQF
jgi:hypothetical protein